MNQLEKEFSKLIKLTLDFSMLCMVQAPTSSALNLPLNGIVQILCHRLKMNWKWMEMFFSRFLCAFEGCWRISSRMNLSKRTSNLSRSSILLSREISKKVIFLHNFNLLLQVSCNEDRQVSMTNLSLWEKFCTCRISGGEFFLVDRIFERA